MANESITFTPSAPTTTDANDGTQAYNMGCLFSVSEAVPCPGVRWRVPDALATPPGAEASHGITLWEDSGAELARALITPTPGSFQDFLFSSPVDLSPGVDYVVAVYTIHYVYSSGAPTGDTSPSGIVTAGTGRLVSSNVGANLAPRPADNSTLTFYVSPLISLGEGDHTTTGTAPATALATGVTATTRPTAATATAAASAAGTTTTTRTTAGSTPVSASASASVSTTRATAASALAAAAARAASATVRTTAGSARAVASASGYVAAGTVAPRLISRSGPGPIITRVRRA